MGRGEGGMRRSTHEQKVRESDMDEETGESEEGRDKKEDREQKEGGDKERKMEEEDKDMIVMQHQFHYQLNGEEKCFHSSLVLEGKDQIHTAMSMTVGLPLAIATKLILQQKIKLSGVQIPVMKEIYEPVLEELKSFGIDFVEQEI